MILLVGNNEMTMEVVAFLITMDLVVTSNKHRTALVYTTDFNEYQFVSGRKIVLHRERRKEFITKMEKVIKQLCQS